MPPNLWKICANRKQSAKKIIFGRLAEILADADKQWSKIVKNIAAWIKIFYLKESVFPF